ncbi:Carotene epsilon-monooxygenase, chloroplastic [Dendrobium catenatum]|uniref:Carotene epsilon-monooxygenase, chloroplastic n=1 Tax=Dendrobium catenatum TaxID=906689 RepID=A0A2I0WQ24_9ASPA|nr:Carotene epsilon-monooxygenase, chloroplastic [Dendrobium catenatum]
MAASSASVFLPLYLYPSLRRNPYPHRHSPFLSRIKSSCLITVSSLGNSGDPGGSESGGSWVSPNWLSSLARSLSAKGDDSGIPVANARLEDVSDLLGGALFLPLYKWMLEYGPVFRLAAGPRDFVIVSDPATAKHVLRSYGSKYAKGLVSEVSQFLFGSGFAIAEGQLWTVRRRAVLPSLHRKFLSEMVNKVFCRCALRLVEKLRPYAINGASVNIEEKFSQLTLDVIGLSLFNYNFDSLTSDSPVIDAVYTALKEAEARSTDIFPYWKVSSVQLRDDLLSMLVAGHETTGSVLTWTLYLLSKDSSALAKAQEEVDNVLGGKFPTYDDVKELKYLTRCIHESMRLYPHPPVLIRRALVADVLPGNFKINVGQDIMISVYNIHRSPFIPFSGGPRKCVGDQFALLEAVIALSIFLQNLNFELVPDQKIGMTTGATIHTTNVSFFGHYYKHFLHFLNLIA